MAREHTWERAGSNEENTAPIFTESSVRIRRPCHRKNGLAGDTFFSLLDYEKGAIFSEMDKDQSLGTGEVTIRIVFWGNNCALRFNKVISITLVSE